MTRVLLVVFSFSLDFFFWGGGGGGGEELKTPIPKKKLADLLHQLVRFLPSVVKLFVEVFLRF